jgi:thiamine-phosphate pyrophosphorylase
MRNLVDSPGGSRVMRPASMRGLYAIVDVATVRARQLEPFAFAEAVLSVRPVALQLRAKDCPARETLALLRGLAPMCHRVGVPLVANDRPDLATLAGCDWVHVGQDDLSIERVRRIAPGLGVGVSTHTLEQLDDALSARPAYVAFGPVFETATKANPDAVVGIVALRAAYARAVEHGRPLVAIGGISLERARALVGATDAVAVISDLLPPRRDDSRTIDVLDDVAERARFFHGLFSQVRDRVPVLH